MNLIYYVTVIVITDPFYLATLGGPMPSAITSLRVGAAALLSVCLGLAACSAPLSASPASSAGGTATGAASATPQAPSLTFSWPGGETPVVTRELTGIQQQYINPGAVIEADGRLHMFANVFTAWPGHVDIPHLTSTDGATWTLAAPTPVLTSDDVPFADAGADVSTGFVTDDGTWVLIIESVSSLDPWVVGRATAPGPDGPWTLDPEPILAPGPTGSFDAGGIHWPSVVRTDDGYAMYYAGFDTPRGAGSIGLATSGDGVTWTRRPDPVLSAAADWEVRKLDRPRVARTPSGYVMVYAGAILTDRGVAWSSDGLTWTRDGDLPAISQETFPIAGRAWDAALIYRDGLLQYFLEIGGTGGTGTNVYRAVAELP
jgi:predicted GH43/DUF377 family glycosyl hydrolase